MRISEVVPATPPRAATIAPTPVIETAPALAGDRVESCPSLAMAPRQGPCGIGAAGASGGWSATDLLRPASRLLQLRALSTTPRLTAEQEKALEDLLRPGDVILVTDNSSPMLQLGTYALLGSGWTHSMIYEGDGKVIEASVAGVGGEGVVRTRLDERVGRQMLFEVVRPPYASPAEARAAVDFCAARVGLPYDYTFTLDNTRAYYCTSLLRHALRACPHPIDVPLTTVAGRQGVGLDSFRDVPGAQVVYSDRSDFWRNTLTRAPEMVAAALLSAAGASVAGAGNAPTAAAAASALTLAVGDACARASDPTSSAACSEPDARPWQRHQRPAVDRGRLPDGRVALGNVRWGVGFNADGVLEGTFQDAVVDLKAVRDAWIVLEPFPPEAVAAHALLCFDGEGRPVVQGADGSTDTGLVVSVEVRLREGERFDMGLGRKQHYPMVYQVGTWRDTVQKACDLRGHRLQRYRLDLLQEQREALLQNALDAAVADRSDERYDTVTNNCVNSALRLLDSVLPDDRRVPDRILCLPNPEAFVPTLVPDALDARGLITDDPRVITRPTAGAPKPGVGPAPPPADEVPAVSAHRSWPWGAIAPAAMVAGSVARGFTAHPLGLAATAAATIVAARLGRAAERAGTWVDEPSITWTAPRLQAADPLAPSPREHTLDAAIARVLSLRHRSGGAVAWADLADFTETTRDGRVRLFLDRDYHESALVPAIMQARDSIHLAMLSFEPGVLGDTVADALIAKKRERPDMAVRVILDAKGSTERTSPWSLHAHVERLREAGIEVKVNNPLVDGLEHRKLLIVDGRTAFLGGSCVSDPYYARPEYLRAYEAALQGGEADMDAFMRARYGDEGVRRMETPFIRNGQRDPSWRPPVKIGASDMEEPEYHDFGVEVTGTAARQLQAGFLQSWLYHGGTLDPRASEADICSRYFPPCVTPSAPGVPTKVVHGIPGRDCMRQDLERMVDAATRTLDIEFAYLLIPDFVAALSRAAARGVKIRLVVPGEDGTDIRATWQGFRGMIGDLMKTGSVSLYETHRYTHVKLMVADSRYVFASTGNPEWNSWSRAFDETVMVDDPALAADVESRVFARDCRPERALEVTPSQAEGSGALRRAGFWVHRALFDAGHAVLPKPQRAEQVAPLPPALLLSHPLGDLDEDGAA